MLKRLLLLIAMVVVPGALLALFVAWAMAKLGRTHAGRRFRVRLRRRVKRFPRWESLVAPALRAR